MTIYDLNLLQRVVFGEDSIDLLGAIIEEHGARRTLIVTDEGVASTGYIERALSSIKRVGLEAIVYDSVGENPTTRDVETGVSFAKKCSSLDLIVAIGGGSPMDCAKAINLLLTNGGTVFDYRGLNRARQPLLPSIGVPTTAGTGSEAQSYAVIADHETHRKMACGDREARFKTVILDPGLSESLSTRQTAITGMDAISHAVESYVSVKSSPVSQMLAREAWHRLQRSYKVVLKDPKNREARRDMLWGSHFAGASIENSMLGAAHACANPLTANYGITHGVAVCLMLPHVVRMNGRVADSMYAELDRIAGLGVSESPSETLAEHLQQMKACADLPLTLRDCGIPAADFPKLAREANQEWTGRFNPTPMNEKLFIELYQEAFSETEVVSNQHG